MNRTDRLYAVVEDLRARAPRRRTARELAARFEVSVRTIERDIGALQQAGVPIYADAGRHGGYAVDKTMTLPPLNFTPAEAVAVAIALDRAGGSPFARSARTAMHKIVAAMSAADSAAARDLAGRIRILSPVDGDPAASVPTVIEDAVAARQVVRLDYVDRNGATTQRDVEPVAFVSGTRDWYFIGWCRLREEARGFRVDRIRRASLLDETAPPRQYEDVGPSIPDLVAHSLEIG
ncbi:helix-turn-helix transcriptional regulator [Actinomadura sp. HBU206391]|uniref:helix-turn-helix transcriptional regulator n=1 Tax=Actinomadura sp. HBU206391 TaxID=2731692 RepID=UPI001650A1B8|nr:YafY family protein [Actinomadura sp. HBU206391]MBC6459650.1 YafY family transcriptional regulator [Actinomadura sp. HBU206391]